jgi:photosystem II stability/assembly factor-like uncharacterized protein
VPNTFKYKNCNSELKTIFSNTKIISMRKLFFLIPSLSLLLFLNAEAGKLSASSNVSYRSPSSSINLDEGAHEFLSVQESLNLFYPSQGMTFLPNSVLKIRWEQSFVTSVMIEFSSDGGSTWNNVISSYPASFEAYNWLVPNTVSSNYKLRITSLTDNTVISFSDIFSVKNPTIIHPNGGENLAANLPYTILWDSEIQNAMALKYSTDGGLNWSLVDTVAVKGDHYYWQNVPSVSSNFCFFKLVSYDDGNSLDVSDAIFGIDTNSNYIDTIEIVSFPSSICRLDTFQIAYQSSFSSYTPGNQFIAQLSDSAGDFSNPTIIGYLVNGQNSGVIDAMLPAHLPNGSNYKIRVIATDRAGIGLSSPGFALTGSSIEFTAANNYLVMPSGAGTQFTFQGQNQNIQTFDWDFGDGGTGSGAVATHTYNKAGFFDVSLSITDVNGCMLELIKPSFIQVENFLPSAPLSLGAISDALAVSFIDTTKGCFAMADGSCRITTDGGLTFTSSSTPAQGALRAASIVPGQWVIAGDSGFAATSSNLGGSWSVFNLNGYTGNLYSVSMNSAYSGLMVGELGAIFLYDSIAWVQLSNLDTNTLYSVAFNGTVGFACGENGALVKYEFTGLSYNNTLTTEDLKGIYFSGNTVYAAGANGIVVKSTDNGNTFNTILSGLDIDLNAISGGGPDSIWAFGTKGVILRSFDGGDTWDRFTNGTLNDNNGGTYKSARGKGWTAGSGANALVFGSGSASSLIEEKPGQQFKLFPNPVVNILTVEGIASSIYALKIFDISGRQYSLKQSRSVNGSLSLDVSPLPLGTYFIEADFGSSRKIGRFVKVR